jgi:molybdenum cofactor sulfurtransferase
VIAGIDALRATEYRRLDDQRQTYLDYTGGGLYAESQLQAHMDLLANGIFGNPHSGNPASLAMTDLVEKTRSAVLEHFSASPDEYVAVFTPNATGALKLVGDAYPFGHYLLSVDNHNSVNGIRELARRSGSVAYAPLLAPQLALDPKRLLHQLAVPRSGPKLFAYPAQSNFSGVQHSLEWIDLAQRRGWDVLLDASAFVPTNRLDLSRWHPDFVALSFYKMFGYPTGVGALIARKTALAKLQRPWFAGGTITLSSVVADDFYLAPGVAGFEDGTINYLSLPAVEIGLRWLDSIGVERIHNRVMSLTDTLLGRLSELRHQNGAPLVRIYGPRDNSARGATIALNLVDPSGTLWDCWEVERLANACRISLRAGCHCNPGAREVALGLEAADLRPHFRDKHRVSYADFRLGIRPVMSGVVRVSLGIASTQADVDRFVEFASRFVDCGGQ